MGLPRRHDALDGPLEQIVLRVARGDATAWDALWTQLEPRLDALVRRPRFLGRLGEREDDCRNVVVEVMKRLHEDGFRRLRLFLDARAQNPELLFMSWLVVVARRVAVDYLRAHGEYLAERRKGGPGVWVTPIALPTDSHLPHIRPAFTDQGTARELLRYAGEHLAPDQHAALSEWAHGQPFEQIARRLALPGGRDAERLVRAALEKLRRKFRGA